LQEKPKLTGLLQRKRILQEDQDLSAFDLNQVKNKPDFYDEATVDPNFDEYVLGQMFGFQQRYEEDRRDGYVSFIENKLHYFDTEYDFENGDDNDVFKTNTNIIVDLENFSTVISDKAAVDIAKHLESTNIDNSIRDLIAHLKTKSKFKILYEKLASNILS
jgi:hypothetical protein